MEAQTVPDVITEIHRWHEVLSSLPPALSEAEAIDRITALEELTSAAAAAQARETLTFDMRRRNREAEDGVSSKKQGKGIGAEVALARKVSRARGSRLLKFSRSLLIDLPQTYSALKTGRISEEKARAVAKETDWLPRDKRRQVDERMADRLAEVGVGRLGNEVRALAQQVDQKAAVEHLERCTEERAVSVRPAPGNMAYLSALLPMPQAVAVYANLKKSAASLISTGESGQRTQSRVMADLLVERATGQDKAEAVPTEIHLVMNDDSLVAPGDTPAWLPGFGPLPAGGAREFVAENEATVFLRRLYVRPEDGQLVRMDSNRREFSGLLRRMIVIRDDVCRSPYCDAQIKHADHATAFATGGDTNWDNASGLCAACNFAKELTGWKHESTPEKLIVKTPTGHRYETRTKPIDARVSENDAGENDAVESQPELAKRGRYRETGQAHSPPLKRRQPNDKPLSRRDASAVEYLFGEQIRTFLTTKPAG
ncbi:MAG: DUF222 domain-containing protein [Brevibacterium sp.]|uniref:HNH endonuclease n=1 Tax=Brevibacterium sp. TaxID=1701 RepID=UPI00264734B8|nr:DUF222 domain-containing protein [Brevibacterium sp.]MDN5806292.1 DUF222 domain-containing protein [Brevibacterium sp.]MDN5832917.1 DUF222 domain-containing protein [Brevibacterium sp.]MDN5875600.1 DUF222 domain-containing protein [Brevibacterium sp.]MDN5909308.1 DUF222 domain-containing protein [Brevibacterium sp.]MDN6133283.1 DUF222 domain-containing protein [Brevibacterium sp.]